MTKKEWCAYAFSKGLANAIKLKILVASGEITAEEYKEITSVEYVA